jgi:hypothetical protein
MVEVELKIGYRMCYECDVKHNHHEVSEDICEL